MKSRRYRKKHKLNVVKLFIVTAMLLVFLGFVITQRNRNQKEIGSGHKMSEEKRNRENEAVVKQILADDRKYP